MRCFGTGREGEFDCQGCADCDDSCQACTDCDDSYDEDYPEVWTEEYCQSNCPEDYPEVVE